MEDRLWKAFGIDDKGSKVIRKELTHREAHLVCYGYAANVPAGWQFFCDGETYYQYDGSIGSEKLVAYVGQGEPISLADLTIQ